MTLKDILEDGYGIDFSTIDFKMKDGSPAKEWVLESMKTNEIYLEDYNEVFPAAHFDMVHDLARTTLSVD